MTEPAVLAELWRGEMMESRHRGHAVIVDDTGQIVEAWGNPETLIYPRSSAKMLQALPLIESGAAERFGLGDEHLALACASHSGAAAHTTRVTDWLASLDLDESALRCGPQVPGDRTARHNLRDRHVEPDQTHNNCSGKHSGFLTLGCHLGGGAEYIDIEHPVQKSVRQAFEDMTGLESPGWGIDGCSAPNFATTVAAFGRAMARMAAPEQLGGVRGTAARRLVDAMIAHPFLVAGENRACTRLMQAARGKAALKTGAEGVYVGILPGRRMGIALKVEDGATRASEAAMAALLVRTGILERDDPCVQAYANAPERNRRNLLAGHLRAAESLF